MFKIYDGREHFYQWDMDRKLIVEDHSIAAVHFCNRTASCSITRHCYEVNGIWLVDVPNLCLQESYRLKVYGFSENRYTNVYEHFDVVARARPEDYVYTEKEVACWEDINERLTALEDNPVSEEYLIETIDKYFIEYPIEKGASEAEKEQIARNTEDIAALKSISATIEYVDNAIAAIDLSGYALKTDIPSLDGYATEEYVDAAKPDLTNYALKIDIPSLEGYAKTTDIPDVSNYQTAEQVQSAIEAYVGVIENGTY